MGHANRSWLDDALGVDTQPRGIRLPVIRRRGESNTNTYSYTYSNSNTYSSHYGNTNCDSNSYAYPHSYADRNS
jgi:hypothetical protein